MEGMVIPCRRQILPHRQQAAAGLQQILHDLGQLPTALSQPDHEAGFDRYGGGDFAAAG